MRTTYLRLVATGWLLLCAVGTAAQQPQPNPDSTLESLRADVRKLRATDRDPNTPDDIREFNRKPLLEKEAQLGPLLVARIRQWRDYLSDKVSALSEEQIRHAEAKIAELEDERRQLVAAPPASDVPANAPVGESAGATEEAQPTGATGGGRPADTASSAAGTQPARRPGVKTLDEQLDITANRIAAARAGTPNAGPAGFDFRNDIDLIALALIPQKANAEAVTEAENARTDKQLEGDEARSGTTSLVSKGGIPAVLGLATAYGALTRTESGNTITFQLNPVGLASALAKRGYISSFQDETSFERFLRNFALGFSFDASRGDTGGVFTGGSQQLSGLSVRYNLINRRDPRERRYTNDFVNLARNQGVQVAGDYGNLIRQVFFSPDHPKSVDEWVEKTNEALRAAPGQERRVLEEQLKKFPVADLPDEVEVTVDSLARNLTGFRQARDELLERVASGLVLTLEYNLERRGDLPDLSNIRFIAEKGPYDGKLDLTFNSSLSFFHSRPTGANTNRLRDFHFAGQIDVPLRETRWTGKPLLSFAGRYQRLLEDETLPNGGTLSAKGDIAVGQLKLTIPIRGTAFKIPLSMSFANRTELLDEKEVRGNFGFTFDLDSIFARLDPFKP